jgi:two-component system LytT family sensor kinase
MENAKSKFIRTFRWMWLPSLLIAILIGLAYAVNYSHYASHYVKIFGGIPCSKFSAQELAVIEESKKFKCEEEPLLAEMIVWELPYWILWTLLLPLVFWLTRRFSLVNGNVWRNYLFHLVFCIGLSMFHRAIYLLIEWIPRVVPAYKEKTLSAVYIDNFFFNLPNGFLCYVTILLAGTYYLYHQEEELEKSQLKAEKTEAQLKSLKRRLHPHFLFNSLNSISARMGSNNESAERMIGKLATFLRMTLDNSGTEQVTLKEEIDYLNSYLAIEQERFADRLTVEIEITPETYDALVPNLILQPIVENAVKHGIMGQIGNGLIQIYSRRRGDRLQLEVRDNGLGLRNGSDTLTQAKNGDGFSITQECLKCLYGEDQSFTFSNAPEGGFQVNLEIPFHTSNGSDKEENRNTK